MRERGGRRLEGEERGSLQGRKNKAEQMPGQWELARLAERGSLRAVGAPRPAQRAPTATSPGAAMATVGEVSSVPPLVRAQPLFCTAYPRTPSLLEPGALKPLVPFSQNPAPQITSPLALEKHMSECGLGRREEPWPMRFGPLPASVHLTASCIVSPSLHLGLLMCGKSWAPPSSSAFCASQQPHWAPEATGQVTDSSQHGHRSHPLPIYSHSSTSFFSRHLFHPSPLLPSLPSFSPPFLSSSLRTLCANPGLGTDASQMDPKGALGLGSSA